MRFASSLSSDLPQKLPLAWGEARRRARSPPLPNTRLIPVESNTAAPSITWLSTAVAHSRPLSRETHAGAPICQPDARRLLSSLRSRPAQECQRRVQRTPRRVGPHTPPRAPQPQRVPSPRLASVGPLARDQVEVPVALRLGLRELRDERGGAQQAERARPQAPRQRRWGGRGARRGAALPPWLEAHLHVGRAHAFLIRQGSPPLAISELLRLGKLVSSIRHLTKPSPFQIREGGEGDVREGAPPSCEEGRGGQTPMAA